MSPVVLVGKGGCMAYRRRGRGRRRGRRGRRGRRMRLRQRIGFRM